MGIVGPHADAQAVIHTGAPTPPVPAVQSAEQIAIQLIYVTPGAMAPGMLESAYRAIAGTAILFRLFATVETVSKIIVEYFSEGGISN